MTSTRPSGEQPDRMDEATLASLDRAGFERFALDVLARHYQECGLEVVHSLLDGGSGEVGGSSYLFRTSETASDGGRLAMALRVLVRISQAAGSAVQDPIGVHVLLAVARNAQKLIVVTNRRFDAAAVSDFEVFCAQHRIALALYDGPKLLRLRGYAHGEDEGEASSDHARSAEATLVRAATRVVLRLSGDVGAGAHHLGTAPLQLEHGEPLFVIADVTAGDDPVAAERVVQAITDALGSAFRPAWSTYRPPLVPGEQCRLVLAGYPPADALVDAAHLLPDGTEGADVDSRGTATVSTPVLAAVDLPSHRDTTAALVERVERWIAGGGVAMAGIRAGAGVGKSHLLRTLRRRWIEAGAAEVFLDGGVHTDAQRIFRRLLAVLLGAPPAGSAVEAALAALLVEGGISAAAAARMAQMVEAHLRAREDARWDTHELADALAALLAVASARRPVVVAVDDLQKINPSGLQLLAEALRLLDFAGRAQVLFVATSRPSAADTDAGSVVAAIGEPLAEVFDVLGVGLCELATPTRDDAALLLERSVAGLDRGLCDVITGQVGTTPFALREVLLLLEQERAVERAGGTGPVFHVRDLDAFRRKLRPAELASATQQRLRTLTAAAGAPRGLRDFLAAGAVLGKTFPTEAARAAAPDLAAAQDEVETLLFRANVLRTWRRDGRSYGEFAHDLIRHAVLKDLEADRLQRVSDRLLEAPLEDVPALSRTRIAYHAGRLDACVEMAAELARDAERQQRHWDALQASLIEISAHDPDSFSRLLGSPDLVGLLTMDDAMQLLVGGPGRAPSREGIDRVYRLIFYCLDTLTRIGVGREHGFDPLLTEAAMLAAERDDEAGRARLEYFAGRAEFERDHFAASAGHHMEAEEVYARLGASGAERLENLNRVFLSARQMGWRKRALAALDSIAALLEASPQVKDPSRVISYRGYAALYFDPAETHRLWREAYEVTRRHGLKSVEIKQLLGCGMAALVLGELDEAEAVFAEVDAAVGEVHLESQRLRLHLDRGVLHLARGRLLEARFDLEEGRRIAARFGMLRHQWRVEANAATLWEAQGSAEKCLASDVRSMAGWLARTEHEERLGAGAPWLSQRHALPAVNVALRTLDGSREHGRLLERLSQPVREVVESHAALVRAGRAAELPGALGYHVREVRGRPRALVTE